MSFRDHIRSCNNYDPERVVPLIAGNDRIGLLRRDNAAALQRFPHVFAVEDDKARLLAIGDAAVVSQAVEGVVDAICDRREFKECKADVQWFCTINL